MLAIIFLVKYFINQYKTNKKVNELKNISNAKLSPQGIEHKELLYDLLSNSTYIQLTLIFLTISLLILTFILGLLTYLQIETLDLSFLRNS